MDKPDVDLIEGLSPAIAIEQKTASHNPRSTVGTVTEIYDYLRLLFARVGSPHCYRCGRPISSQTIDQIVDRVMSLPEGSRAIILAPLVTGQKGGHQVLFKRLKKDGFARVRIDGNIVDIEEIPDLGKTKKHDIDVVVDRLVVKDGIQNAWPILWNWRWLNQGDLLRWIPRKRKPFYSMKNRPAQLAVSVIPISPRPVFLSIHPRAPVRPATAWAGPPSWILN